MSLRFQNTFEVESICVMTVLRKMFKTNSTRYRKEGSNQGVGECGTGPWQAPKEQSHSW